MKRALALAVAACTVALALATSTTGQAQGPFELNIGSLAPKGTPWWDMLETFEKNVEEGSAGKINVIIRPAGQLGEVEMVRETRRGERLQGCGVTTAAIAEGGALKELQTVELPYLFNNNDEADYILDNVLWAPMSDLLARRGFVLGIWSENGWRSFGTKRRAIRTPDDLKAFKMRSQESDVHMAMYALYGAQAVQKPMTEVLTSLQSNVVDGLDNTALYIMSGGLGDALEYYTLTRHIYQPAAVIFSKRWFDTLTPDLQKLLMDQRSLATQGRAAIRTEDEAIVELMKESLQVVELTPAEREAFATMARGMHRSFAEGIGATALYETIDKALIAYRAR